MWTWRNFNPPWSHQIECRAGNGFICFSEKWRVISRKKLHSVCKLTKGYRHAKEEGIWFLELCRSFAILFDSCTDLLLSTNKLNKEQSVSRWRTKNRYQLSIKIGITGEIFQIHKFHHFITLFSRILTHYSSCLSLELLQCSFPPSWSPKLNKTAEGM